MESETECTVLDSSPTESVGDNCDIGGDEWASIQCLRVSMESETECTVTESSPTEPVGDNCDIGGDECASSQCLRLRALSVPASCHVSVCLSPSVSQCTPLQTEHISRTKISIHVVCSHPPVTLRGVNGINANAA